MRARLGPGALVLGVATLVRLWVLIDGRDAPFWRVPIMDETTSIELARRLLAGLPPEHGAYYVAPGYGYVLALVFSAGGGALAVKLLQLGAGVASAGLVLRLTRRWFGGGAGLAAGLAWALYPAALLQEVLLLKTSFAVLCGLVALTALTGTRRPTSLYGAAAGVALGAAALLRGELIVLAGVLAAAAGLATWRRWPGAPSGPACVALLLAAAAVVAVPTLQNWRRSGEAVGFAYGGGVNFYIGNHAQADGGYVPLRPERSDVRMEEEDAVLLARAAGGADLGPAGVSRYWWGRGLDWWRREPAAAVRLALRKWALLWGPHEIADVLSTPLAGRWIVALRERLVGPWLMLPAALAGLWATRRRRELWALQAAVAGCQLALVPFFLLDRFRLPFVALCLPFAAAAGAAAVGLARAQRWRRLAAALAVTAALGAGLSLVRVERDPAVLGINIGEMLREAGRYPEALREFEAVRAAAPDYFRVDIGVANTLWAMGRHREALQAFERVLPPLHTEARRTGMPSVGEIVYCEGRAGDLATTLRRWDDAARHYEAALELAPERDRPELRRKLRLVHEAAGR
jgi:4-amino-4-deoxy-L-arabinose transferase-like glycosyltransferase